MSDFLKDVMLVTGGMFLGVCISYAVVLFTLEFQSMEISKKFEEKIRRKAKRKEGGLDLKS